MDSNPRHFFLDVKEMEANVDGNAREDFVTLEFGGTITPTLKRRLMDAMKAGNVDITPKKFG